MNDRRRSIGRRSARERMEVVRMRRRSPLFWLGMLWLFRRFMRYGPLGRRFGHGFGGPRYGFGGYRHDRGFHYL
jgi:hypothetical protein